jgi:mono/diheme cytochrome c family protein
LYRLIVKRCLSLLLPLVLLATLPATAQTVADTDAIATGRRIYLEGILPDGKALHGVRLDTGVVEGSTAACVNCHRPSGLGMVEGTVGVPPISGPALFGGGEPVIVRMDSLFDRGFSVPHAPYDQASLTAAIRDGHHQSGREMHALMPRYTLSDAHVQAVSSYLKTLSSATSPAVSADSIHIATVIAPGISPERRKAFLSTMTTLLNQSNINVKSSNRQKMVSAIERRLGTRRKLDLDIWELSGPSSTWGEQLRRQQQEHPVFGILSGLSQNEWQPVQQFCENSRIACWFPSVNLVPAGAAQSQFSLYFSAGIDLEAEVIASKLVLSRGRTVQLVADDAVARGGAAALRRVLAANNTGEARDVIDINVAGGAKEVQKVLASLGDRDALVLWLKPTDLAALTKLEATKASVYVSALLGGDAAELAGTLRERAFLVQTLEVEHVRNFNLERCNKWLNAMKIPVVDQRMQSEVYFATRALIAAVHGMLNNLHTDYLIERAEATLSMFEAMQVQEEIQDMMMGPMNKRPLSSTPLTAAENAAMNEQSKVIAAHLEEMRMRGGTTVYPRLNLAQGQRFASKGAYLERLNPDAPGIIGEPEWVVP